MSIALSKTITIKNMPSSTLLSQDALATPLNTQHESHLTHFPYQKQINHTILQTNAGQNSAAIAELPEYFKRAKSSLKMRHKLVEYPRIGSVLCPTCII
ncbi:hypothetical protein NPIL_473261 [Nephila pilipes]|uniref:Uncharacterized protein n=1 Tax=Nephila pilipes TaxID=299642 RepID=A0A8X6PWD8_NEPPI|nr:hypothetical protein NPIL_473261 [Nephila pilipes]